MRPGTALRHAHGHARPSSKGSWTYWAAVGPTLAAIVGFGGVYSYIWAPLDAILFLALAAYLWRRALAGRTLAGHPILLPMGGFGLLVAAQFGLGLSVYPGATLSEAIKLAGCGVVFYLALVAFRRTSNLLRLGGLLWLFCGLLAVEAVLQAFGANGYIYWFHDAAYATPVGPFVYHNFYAGCMDLLLPVATVYSFRAEPASEAMWAVWLRRGLIPAVAVGSIVISQSRGGILIMVAEAVLGLIVFWPELMRKRVRRVSMAAGAILLLGFSFLANWGPVAHRFINLTKRDPSAVERLEVSRSCWLIFLGHPWLGTGFGTFAAVYPAYQTFDDGLTWDQAHNDYAQALAETGALGGLCVAGFLGIWALNFWRCRASREESGPVRILRLACFIGTAGFLAHSFGDFQFHAPGNALLFFLLAAAALGVPAKARTRWRREPNLAPGGVIS